MIFSPKYSTQKKELRGIYNSGTKAGEDRMDRGQRHKRLQGHLGPGIQSRLSTTTIKYPSCGSYGNRREKIIARFRIDGRNQLSLSGKTSLRNQKRTLPGADWA